MPKHHHSKQIVPASWPIREGEGVGLDVSVTHDVAVSGKTVSLMQVDFRAAPVPDRKYVAEICSVDQQQRTIRLMFGQRRIGRDELRTLIIVEMSEFSASQFLATVDQISGPTYEDILATLGQEAEPIVPITSEPDQSLAMSANMILSAVSGDEAAMDFFKASPFSIQAAPHRGKLMLDPVVRVDLRSSAMVGLIHELRRIEKHFSVRAKTEE